MIDFLDTMLGLQNALKKADERADYLLSILESSTLADFYKLPPTDGLTLLSVIVKADEKAKKTAQKISGAKYVTDGRWSLKRKVLESANPAIKELMLQGTKHHQITNILWDNKQDYRFFKSAGNRDLKISRNVFMKHVKQYLISHGREDLIYKRLPKHTPK